jgi:hypothetical protein
VQEGGVDLMAIDAFRSGRIDVRNRDLLGGLRRLGLRWGFLFFLGIEFSFSGESSYIDG